MKKIVIILADGAEETEFIAVGDVLRRHLAGAGVRFAENSRCAPDWRFVALPVESPGYCVPGEEASRLFAGEFSSCRQFVGRKMNKNSRGNPRKRTKL